MREIIKPALTLFIICVITTILLAGVKMVTQGTIDARTLADLELAKKSVLSQAETFEELSAEKVASVIAGAQANEYLATIQQVYVGRDAAGAFTGCVYRSKSRGYDASGIKMTIGVAADGSIVDIKIVEQIETPGLGTNVLEPKGAYMSQYRGKAFADGVNLVKTAPSTPRDVQAVSGATITSRAISRAVEGALQFSRALAAMGVIQ